METKNKKPKCENCNKPINECCCDDNNAFDD